MKRVFAGALALFATIGSASAETMTLAEALVDFPDLVGKTVSINCDRLFASGSSSLACFGAEGQAIMMMVDLQSADRESRKFAITQCSTADTCKAVMTGKIERFMGANTPILTGAHLQPR
ncbi:hypothetical protein [Kaistia sp. MMO-174]|uniref:hypothetical protein n=1 Tax=Kaistia sp. MMO-174 TaxID=3081256 RepID=UPI00301A1A32